MNYTAEQNLAIHLRGNNILVSAGAGSGKTAVLTTRIAKMVEDGIPIQEILVLTFTKAAALEMTERIRKRLIDSPHLQHALAYLDSAYITTFDAFSFSVVKKFHYLIDVRRDLSIIDGSVMSVVEQTILDQLFEEYYCKSSAPFRNLIQTFTAKQDQTLKQELLQICHLLAIRHHRTEYLATYGKEMFSEHKIEQEINLFLNTFQKELKQFQFLVREGMEVVEEKHQEKLQEILDFLKEEKTYAELQYFFQTLKLPIVRNATEEWNACKEVLKNKIELYKESYLGYESLLEMKELYLMTKPYIETLIELVEQFFQRVEIWKQEHSLYEFHDIALMAIRIVEEFPEARKELQASFQEILIDEYQDTSDLQEIFIQALAKNNVYMVGDIKQSIYRFRNANPALFKEKYDTYQSVVYNEEGQAIGLDYQAPGWKIDMNRNFRSRKEVLSDINEMFCGLMTDAYGNANYSASHQMQYGNHSYDQLQNSNQNYYAEFLVYKKEEYPYAASTMEAFLIGNKIKEIVGSEEVVDKKTGRLRKATYADITILIDRTGSFKEYRQIFSYLNIPINVLQDELLNDSLMMTVLFSIMKLLTLDKYQQKKEYSSYLVSVARSFLVEYDDSMIFDMIINRAPSDLEERIHFLRQEIHTLSPVALFQNILIEFQFYEKLERVGNVREHLINLEMIHNLVLSLSKNGQTFLEITNTVERVFSQGISLKKPAIENPGGVKLMNIHKSKGLEFPICFFAGLDKRFNMQDLNSKFIFQDPFGFIIPGIQEGLRSTFRAVLLKEYFIQEDISEKLRLFYVALTRAKEKMYFVIPFKDSKEKDISKAHSFYDFLEIISEYWETKAKDASPYLKGITDQYRSVSKSYEYPIKSAEQYRYQERFFQPTLQSKGKISKKIEELVNPKLAEQIALGLEFHALLEAVDLKNPKLEYLNISTTLKERFYKVMEMDCFQHIQTAKVYQELEFIFEQGEEQFHGIIDLLLEYEDHIEIIDYKLSNTEKKEYERQLQVYFQYIQKVSTKPIKVYLLSLLKCEIKEIEIAYNM